MIPNFSDYSMWGEIQRNTFAYWTLNEASGSLHKDSSGSGYDLTIAGATLGVAGHILKAASYDGVDDVSDSTDSGLITKCKALTNYGVSFWAKAPQNQDECAISICETETDEGLGIYPYWNQKGQLQVRVWWDANLIVQDASHTVDVWNHFLFRTRNGNDHEILVNNVSVGTSTDSVTMTSTIDTVSIGAWGDGYEWYAGNVDEVRLIDIYPTDQMVATLAGM